MVVDFNDFYAIIKIALVLLFSSFALLIPLCVLLGSAKQALRYSIPLSICFQIIIGYFFYSFGPIRLYPIIYFVVIIIMNIVATKWQISTGKERWSLKVGKEKLLYILLLVLCFIPIIYTRFYDALHNIAPGTIDTMAHYTFIFHDLDQYGYLGSTFYAPGYHLLLYPLKFFVSGMEAYRFAGPVLATITALALFLMFRETFKSKVMPFVLLLLLALPVFNQLTLQMMGFFSSALSFILLPFLIIIIVASQDLKPKVALLFYFFGVATLSLTVPYLYVQYIPALLLFALVVTIMKKKFSPVYTQYVWKIVFLTAVGFFLAYGHVYFQTNVLKRGSGFPAVDSVERVGEKLVTVSSSVSADNLMSKISGETGKDAGDQANVSTPSPGKERKILQAITQNKLFRNYILPSLMTGRDILRVKNIRSFSGVLSRGAYLWIALCFVSFTYATKKRDLNLLAIITFSIVFGFCTQTGALEMSTYRGRSGWYLLFFALIGSAYVMDIIIRNMPKRLLCIIVPAMFTISFFAPPVYYRGYFTEPFVQAKAISKEFEGQNILFLTNESQITLVSSKFNQKPLNTDSLKDVCQFDKCFMILENRFLDLDPILSQRASAADKDFTEFYKQQALRRNAFQENLWAIKASPDFSKYKYYWGDENVTIYEYTK